MRSRASIHTCLMLCLAGCGGNASQLGEHDGERRTEDAGVSTDDAGVSTECFPEQFVMNATSGGNYCLGTGSCPAPRLPTLTAADGTPITMMRSNCEMECSTCGTDWPYCHSVVCYGAPLPGNGRVIEWTGESWLEGACGENANRCVTPTCAPAGHYVVRMCAYAAPDSDHDGFACGPDAAPEPTCVDVPFEHPAPGPVVGTLPGGP